MTSKPKPQRKVKSKPSGRTPGGVMAQRRTYLQQTTHPKEKLRIKVKRSAKERRERKCIEGVGGGEREEQD
jgi:hypothetical protein